MRLRARGSVLIRETAPRIRGCRTEIGSSIKLLINVLLEILHRVNTRARARVHVRALTCTVRALSHAIPSRGSDKEPGGGEG